MKVLICGEYGVFCKELIARLKKERHEIFVITGSEKPKRKKPQEGVFQDYNFSYSSNSIRTIYKNIVPDAMIILGACDIKFTWEDTYQESVRYLTGITNLLMGAKAVGISNVIYCSTLGVLEEEDQNKETENLNKSARRGVFIQTMAQMDNICEEQNGTDGFRVKKIHFGEVYGDYGVSPYSICNEMAQAYWKEDPIRISSDKKHRVIYVNDAVECIMKVLLMESDSVNYCAEGSVYTEKEIIDTIKTVLKGKKVQIEESAERSVLPDLSKAADEKVFFRNKYSLKDGLERLRKLVEKEKAFEVEKEKKQPIIKNVLLPLAENIGLFFVAFFATGLLQDTWIGSQININLYLFYVVIIAVVYGINHALLATVLVFITKSIELLHLGNAFDYSSYIDVLQILVIGVISGYLRDKYKRKGGDLEDEKKYYQSELVDMTKIYDSNLYVKGLYEKRLINYENSMAKIYEIVSRLDFWEPQKVFFQAVDVLKELMEMNDVAIYIAGKDTQYLRLTASTPGRARSMGASICANDDFFMKSELVERVVYRNKDFESKNPSYACGVFTQDTLTAIVMLWTDDLTKINLYQANMLALLCRLIETAMNRARLYWNTLAGQYIEGTNILKTEGIDKMIDVCRQGEAEEKMVYQLLRIPQSFMQANKEMVFKRMGSMVRTTDYVGLKEDGVYIILMNVNVEESSFVIKRFEKAGIPIERVAR